jgi:hypothetical protein
MVWVSSELSTAINMTKPPLRIEWSTWKFPYPAMIMMVPAGAISVDRDDINIHADVEFIYFAADETNEMLHFVAGTKDGLFDWNYSRVDFPVLDLTDLEGQHEAVMTRRSGEVSKSEGEVYQYIGRCIRYLFGALLIMADRPDLIGPATLVKKVQKKGEHPKEFWTPQVLGAEYKIRRETTQQLEPTTHPAFTGFEASTEIRYMEKAAPCVSEFGSNPLNEVGIKGSERRLWICFPVYPCPASRIANHSLRVFRVHDGQMSVCATNSRREAARHSCSSKFYSLFQLSGFTCDD